MGSREGTEVLAHHSQSPGPGPAPLHAEVDHDVDQTGSTVAPTQPGIGCLLRVQGGGEWQGEMHMVRSGREPPVFIAGGKIVTLAGWSGDGKMVIRETSRTEVGRG